MNHDVRAPRAPRSVKERLRILAATGLALGLLGAIQVDAISAASAEGIFSGPTVPQVMTDPDTASVELGVRFSSGAAGSVTGIRFFKGPNNTGSHVATLWNSSGDAIATATYTGETESGWQTATFAAPVVVTPGETYTASYVAPTGRYAAEQGGFSEPRTSGPLTVPADGGVYAYGDGAFPTETYKQSNYYVDVVFSADATTEAPSAEPEAATPAPAITPAPAPVAAPVEAPALSAPAPGAGTGVLDLPRVPWEGGSDYWKKFPKTDAANWDDPSFFPVVVWYNGISSDAEAAYDKSVGINTYIGMSAETDYQLFEDNDVYWIGSELNSTFSGEATNWVGNFLDDEVDGRFEPAAGRAHLQQLSDKVAGNGRFNYTNFTQTVVGPDMPAADAEAYVNDYSDAVSLDMYWYTVPFCDWEPYRGEAYLAPVADSNCRTASSYGKSAQMLRERDAADGELQPIWQFVENLNGGPGASEAAVYIKPEEVQGAAMSSVINEARGLVYFNQSLSGDCQSANVTREAQVTPNFCGAAQVAAMGEINQKIHGLAPVINTQSYEYEFGAGLDTMLKTYDGSAYVFAMVDGETQPGARTFTLPAGVTGSEVTVVGENRTIPVTNGTFTDDFAEEFSHHVYSVSL
ncbi:MAG: hypothetical protein JWM51_1047 [Microbacteriaceae bacterium]|nr:hypothetical protein [Microbacteriaceae bacterium]